MRNDRFKRTDPRDGLIFNSGIRAPTVRLTSSTEAAEVLPLAVALAKARDQNQDLIVISNNGDVPVVKIMEVNKFLYEKKQRQKEAAKKARAAVIETKEIRMGLNIGQNDIDVKVKNARKMLDKQCKVLLTVTLRGRERGKQNLARELLIKIAEQLEVELEPFTSNGNRVSARVKMGK